MAAPTITPAALIERLMTVYNATSQEDLARQLGVPSRRVSDYKAGKGMRFDRTVDLLNRAGWLTPTAINEPAIDARARGAAPVDPLEELAGAVAELLEGQRLLLHAAGLGANPGPPQAASTRKRRGAAR